MKRRILIFDDDQDILNICSIILKTRGFEVATSVSCDDLIEKITASAPDVIFMDNKIPEIGGVEAIRLIKRDRRTNEIPVILFSAHSQVEELTRQAGADSYIQKPFSIEEFEQVLESAFKKKTQ